MNAYPASTPKAAREADVSNRGLWLEGVTTSPNNVTRALGVVLIIAWVLLIVAKNPAPSVGSRFECGTDPWDFLRIGEMLEASSLQFLVDAHCSNAKYLPDGGIELRYRGARVDVSVRPVDIAGTTYYEILSIGGIGMPPSRKDGSAAPSQELGDRRAIEPGATARSQPSRAAMVAARAAETTSPLPR